MLIASFSGRGGPHCAPPLKGRRAARRRSPALARAPSRHNAGARRSRRALIKSALRAAASLRLSGRRRSRVKAAGGRGITSRRERGRRSPARGLQNAELFSRAAIIFRSLSSLPNQRIKAARGRASSPPRGAPRGARRKRIVRGVPRKIPPALRLKSEESEGAARSARGRKPIVPPPLVRGLPLIISMSREIRLARPLSRFSTAAARSAPPSVSATVGRSSLPGRSSAHYNFLNTSAELEATVPRLSEWKQQRVRISFM